MSRRKRRRRRRKRRRRKGIKVYINIFIIYVDIYLSYHLRQLYSSVLFRSSVPPWFYCFNILALSISSELIDIF